MVDGKYTKGVDGLGRKLESVLGRVKNALGGIAEVGSGVLEEGITVGYSAGIGPKKINFSLALEGTTKPTSDALDQHTAGILDDPASYDATYFDANVLDTNPTNNFSYYQERISTIIDNLAEGNRDVFVMEFLAQFRSYLTELRKNNVAKNDRITAQLIEEALIIILKIEIKGLWSIGDAKLKKRFDILDNILADVENRIGCKSCDIAMRPAGSSYVCEGCGRNIKYYTQENVDSEGNGDDGPSFGGSDGGEEGPDDGEDDGGSVPGVPRKPIPGAGFMGDTQVDGGDTESSPEAQSLVDIGNRLTNKLEHLESLRDGFTRDNGNSPYFVYVSGDNGLQAIAKAVWADLLVLSNMVDFAVVLDAPQANDITRISEFNSNTENEVISDAFDFIIDLLRKIISGLQTRSQSRSQYRSSKT